MPRLLFHVALLILCLSGCAPTITGLNHEDGVPELAALKQRTLAHANHTTLVPTGRAPTTVRIAVHEIDRPGSDRIFVLIHGIMADHRAFRFMVGSLTEAGSVWLVDLPGCGDSDKPDPAALGPDGYSPVALAERTLDALAQRLQARAGPPPRLALVGHSLGGTVVMRTLADPALRARHAAVLARVDAAVLFSPLDIVLQRPDPLFLQIATIESWEVRMASALGLLERRVATAIRASVCDPGRALHEEFDLRLSHMTDPARRRALQAMLRQAVPWRDGLRPDWEAMEAVTGAYRNIDCPCLIVWGERDEVLPCAMGYKLAAQIPAARLVCLPRVKHSPEIECPEKAAGLIVEFVEEVR